MVEIAISTKIEFKTYSRVPIERPVSNKRSEWKTFKNTINALSLINVLGGNLCVLALLSGFYLRNTNSF